MQGIPHREYLTWMAYRSNQWNKPSRTDYYLMQLAREVRQTLTKKGEDLLKFLIPFKRKVPPTKEQLAKQKEVALAQSRAKWFGIAGYKPKPKLMDPPDG